MKKLLFIILLLTGCATLNESLQAKTSGLIGCPSEEIKISNYQVLHSVQQSTFIAECRGKIFYCSKQIGHPLVNCHEEIKK